MIRSNRSSPGSTRPLPRRKVWCTIFVFTCTLLVADVRELTKGSQEAGWWDQ